MLEDSLVEIGPEKKAGQIIFQSAKRADVAGSIFAMESALSRTGFLSGEDYRLDRLKG